MYRPMLCECLPIVEPEPELDEIEEPVQPPQQVLVPWDIQRQYV